MEKNSLLELIKQISNVAANIPQNQKQPDSEAKQTGSFVKNTAEPNNTSQAAQKVDRTKPRAPSTDAIIKMIHRHDNIKREIENPKP